MATPDAKAANADLHAAGADVDEVLDPRRAAYVLSARS
jgi:hypothetical protein